MRACAYTNFSKALLQNVLITKGGVHPSKKLHRGISYQLFSSGHFYNLGERTFFLLFWNVKWQSTTKKTTIFLLISKKNCNLRFIFAKTNKQIPVKAQRCQLFVKTRYCQHLHFVYICTHKNKLVKGFTFIFQIRSS